MKKYFIIAITSGLLAACGNDNKNSQVSTKTDSTSATIDEPKEIKSQPLRMQNIKTALFSQGYEMGKDSVDDSRLFTEYIGNFAKQEKVDISVCHWSKVTKYFFVRKGQDVKNDTKYLASGLNKLTGVVLVRDIEFQSAPDCDSCLIKAAQAFKRDLFPVGSAYKKENHIFYIEAENQNDTPNYIQVDSIIKMLAEN